MVASLVAVNQHSPLGMALSSKHKLAKPHRILEGLNLGVLTVRLDLRVPDRRSWQPTA